MSAPRQLVLAGAGLAHARVLADWARAPLPGVALCLVAPRPLALHPARVPAWLAGWESLAAASVDLAALARAAGARWLPAAPVSADLARGRLWLDDGQALAFDLLSLDTGRQMQPPPVPPAGRVLTLQPLDALPEAWAALWQDPWLQADPSPLAITTIGGGAAGVQALLAVCARLRRDLPQRTLLPRLVTRGPNVLPGWPAPLVARATAALARARVQLQLGVDGERLLRQPARAPGLLLWAADPRPDDWPQAAGLACGASGAVVVDAQGRSVSHPQVFAVGEVAETGGAAGPRPGELLAGQKALQALASGPLLSRNLRAALAGQALAVDRPRPPRWAMLDIGDRRAAAAWGKHAVEGAWLWPLKRRREQAALARLRAAGG